MLFKSRRIPLFRHMAMVWCVSLLMVVVHSRDTSSKIQERMEEQIYHSPFLQSLSIHDRCRLFPTWSSSSTTDDDSSLVSWDDCETAHFYFPQNFGLFNGSAAEYPHQDLHWLYQLQDCMQEAQKQRLQGYFWDEFEMVWTNDNDEGEFDFWKTFLQRNPLRPTTVAFEYPSMETLSLQQQQEGAEIVPPVAIVVEDALHMLEVDTLEDLKQCLRTHQSHLAEIRPFGQNYDEGGNNCVFLGGFLQFLTPGVAAKIRQAGHVAWTHAQWGEFVPPLHTVHPDGYKDPLEAGIRTSDHISYEGWEALGPHKDSDSLYTVLVMLSNPDDYDGGEFHMQVDRSGNQSEQQRRLDESHPPLVLKPKKYDCVVFLADENTHQVLSIGGGDRKTVATEFWGHGDCPFGIKRPSPEMWLNYQSSHEWR